MHIQDAHAELAWVTLTFRILSLTLNAPWKTKTLHNHTFNVIPEPWRCGPRLNVLSHSLCLDFLQINIRNKPIALYYLSH